MRGDVEPAREGRRSRARRPGTLEQAPADVAQVPLPRPWRAAGHRSMRTVWPSSPSARVSPRRLRPPCGDMIAACRSIGPERSSALGSSSSLPGRSSSAAARSRRRSFRPSSPTPLTFPARPQLALQSCSRRISASDPRGPSSSFSPSGTRPTRGSVHGCSSASCGRPAQCRAGTPRFRSARGAACFTARSRPGSTSSTPSATPIASAGHCAQRAVRPR